MSVKQMSVWSVLWLLAVAGVPASANAPLADAAEKRNQAQIQRLLEQAVDVNAAQVDGMTALHWTTLHDDLETARLLVEAGADVTVANRYAASPERNYRGKDAHRPKGRSGASNHEPNGLVPPMPTMTFKRHPIR